MIRRLIILLLIVGCDIFEDEDTHTHDGICVIKYESVYYCYSKLTQVECIEDTALNWWFETQECSEFCQNTSNDCIASSSECEESANSSTYYCDKY